MFSVAKDNPKYLVAALILHLLIIGFFVFSFHWFTPVRSSPPTARATLVTEQKQQLVAKKIEEPVIQQKKQEEQKKESEREQKKKEEDRKQIALEEEKKQKRQKEQEEKRKQEEQKKEQQQREKDFHDRIAAEQKRMEDQLKQQELARKQAEAEALAREQDEKRKRTIIDEYRDKIHAHVRRYWIEPPNIKSNPVCELRISLIPSGDVVDIKISKSSGNEAFDRSVENAVRKASPLPLPPPEKGLFDVFKELHFRFGRQT